MEMLKECLLIIDPLIRLKEIE
jgi:protein phosphatase PTC1